MAQQPLTGQPTWSPQPPPPPAPPRPHTETKWPQTLALVAVLLFVAFGGFFFSGTPGLAGDSALVSPIRVTDTVTMQPAAGWAVQSENTDPPGVTLAGSTGHLVAGVFEGQASPEAMLDAFIAEYFEAESSQLAVSEPEPIEHQAGAAVHAGYVGLFDGAPVPLEGRVTAIVSPGGVGVIVDGWAEEGVYGAIAAQVEAMAGSVTIA